jgi:hypothetical protein
MFGILRACRRKLTKTNVSADRTYEMNTTTKSRYAFEHDELRLVELFSMLESASLSTTMSAAGLFMPVPYTNDARKISVADADF